MSGDLLQIGGQIWLALTGIVVVAWLALSAVAWSSVNSSVSCMIWKVLNANCSCEAGAR